jgi:hypothetical protein
VIIVWAEGGFKVRASCFGEGLIGIDGEFTLCKEEAYEISQLFSLRR